MNQYPYLVDWAISSKCNLSCQHCRGFSEDELSTQEARKVVGEVAGLRPGWVIVEGGEPLLRNDLFELLGLMRQEGLEVHLITNGMLCSPEIIKGLGRLSVKVMVSLDGATAATYETIRTGASFSQVIKAICEYARANLLEALNFTVMKQNYAEIPGVFELAQALGVPKITLIGLKPCHNYDTELLSPEEYMAAIKLTCQAAQQTGVDFFFDEPFFGALVKELGFVARAPATNAGILVPSNSACIFGEYLFIEPNGEVKPCSFAPLGVGNVRQDSLQEIWHRMVASPLLSRIREAKSRTGKCQSCPHLAECKGCRSRTFLLTGDWFAADPVCPLSSNLLKMGAKNESTGH